MTPVLFSYIFILFQTVGFLGAIRLNQKLLNSYWISLLVLLIGDILVGGFWLFKYNQISLQLRAQLERRFQQEYSRPNLQFRDLWDDIQQDHHCCGVNGPRDFNVSWWQDEIFERLEEHEAFNKSDVILLPWSCCTPASKDLVNKFDEPNAMANTIRGRLRAKSKEGEDKKDDDDQLLSSTVSPKKTKKKTKHLIADLLEEGPLLKPNQWCRYSSNRAARWHYHRGCHKPLQTWLDNSADAMFVIGFCVIGFLKFTFLGLLKVEIKEMIQKIKVLKNEETQGVSALAMALHDVAEQSPSQETSKKASPTKSSPDGKPNGNSPNRSSVAVRNEMMSAPNEDNSTPQTMANHVNNQELDATSCSALLVASQQSTPAHLNNHSSSSNRVASTANAIRANLSNSLLSTLAGKDKGEPVAI